MRRNDMPRRVVAHVLIAFSNRDGVFGLGGLRGDVLDGG